MSKTLPLRRRGRPPRELAGYSATQTRWSVQVPPMLTEKGYSATGIDEVLRSVDVPKGSFYITFQAKKHLERN